MADALKCINKKALISAHAKSRTSRLLFEKQALDELHHPFLISMMSAYQDRVNIYLLLDVALGGELYQVMSEVADTMDEPMAKFYTASLTLALQHVHLLEFVYRDLKPENVLLDRHGFVKLCDFGFAKKVVDRTYTKCGTPDYVAPEMLLNQGVNQACDWCAAPRAVRFLLLLLLQSHSAAILSPRTRTRCPHPLPLPLPGSHSSRCRIW